MCAANTPHLQNNIETLQDSRLWEFSPAAAVAVVFCRKEFLVRLLPVIVKLSYLKKHLISILKSNSASHLAVLPRDFMKKEKDQTSWEDMEWKKISNY